MSKPCSIEALVSQLCIRLLESNIEGEQIRPSHESAPSPLLKYEPLTKIDTFGKDEMNNLPLNAAVLFNGPEGQTICRRAPGGWIYSMIYNNTSVFISKFE